jgi:hypothetical protein
MTRNRPIQRSPTNFYDDDGNVDSSISLQQFGRGKRKRNDENIDHNEMIELKSNEIPIYADNGRPIRASKLIAFERSKQQSTNERSKRMSGTTKRYWQLIVEAFEQKSNPKNGVSKMAIRLYVQQFSMNINAFNKVWNQLIEVGITVETKAGWARLPAGYEQRIEIWRNGQTMEDKQSDEQPNDDDDDVQIIEQSDSYSTFEDVLTHYFSLPDSPFVKLAQITASPICNVFDSPDIKRNDLNLFYSKYGLLILQTCLKVLFRTPQTKHSASDALRATEAAPKSFIRFWNTTSNTGGTHFEQMLLTLMEQQAIVFNDGVFSICDVKDRASTKLRVKRQEKIKANQSSVVPRRTIQKSQNATNLAAHNEHLRELKLQQAVKR